MRIVRLMFNTCLISSCALVILAPCRLAAQDTHYWNNQYGPRSMLLGGAVIGTVHDMSATYYNPGALGYVKEPELLLSANAYQLSALKIEGGGGRGIDLESSDFNLLPNMLSGAFKSSWLGENRIAYSFLTRHRFNAETKGGRTTRTDALPGIPGDEDFAGGLYASAKVSELWAGLTWARAAQDKVGIGVTQYVSIRSQKSEVQLFAQALSDSGDIALLSNLEVLSSSVWSLLWKAGVGFNFWPLTAGVTLTTPNVRLFGSGEAALNATRAGVDVDNDSIPDNGFETDFQENVTANYKSPWSVGVGAGYHMEHTKVHVSAEWFNNVDPYTALELQPFVSQATGQVVAIPTQEERKSAFNFAVGLEQEFGDKYSGYLSFNTDKSAFSDASDLSVTGYDIYHVTGGANVVFGKTQWMIGYSYAWGSETIQQLVDLDPDGGVSPTDPANDVEFLYNRSTFMVGFTVAI